MNRVILRSLRPVAANLLAAAALCALAGVVFGPAGAGIRHRSPRASVLNWLADDLPGADIALPNTAATPPRRRPAVAAARWRGCCDRTAALPDGLPRSHVTRISLPPPAAESSTA